MDFPTALNRQLAQLAQLAEVRERKAGQYIRHLLKKHDRLEQAAEANRAEIVYELSQHVSQHVSQLPMGKRKR